MGTRPVSAQTSKGLNVALWTLQGLLMAAFVYSGTAKLLGQPSMVETFDKIGVGQWFRIVTGSIEMVGGAALLWARTAYYGAILLACTMLGALMTHLLLIGGSPANAIVLLALTGAVAWGRRRGSARSAAD